MVEERIENDKITKSVCVGECAGSRSVGRQLKRVIEIVKNCLKTEVWMLGK